MGGRPVKQRVVDKTVSTFDDSKHDVHHHTQKCGVRFFFPQLLRLGLHKQKSSNLSFGGGAMGF